MTTILANEAPPRVAISAKGLVKSFGDGDNRMTAVNDVTLSVHFGEMLFIVGPSGSGKTTLLSIVSGILRPDAGSVDIHGVDLWAFDTSALADFRLYNIGFVFQDFHLFPRLTSLENVAIPLLLQGSDWGAAMLEADRDLGIVGLGGRGGILPVKLSGGEQQRVAIARAIVSRPQILIMDEPTASLDGDTGRTIISFVKSQFLNADRCIVIVSHDMRINEFADRIIQMEDGRITGPWTANEKRTE